MLGTGNSGHDVAQDLCASGADVTIVQRSPTYVVSIREAQKVYAIYSEGLPFADCDLLAASMPYPVLLRAYQLSTAEMREADRALLQGLEARGFRLTYGEDDTGFQMMYLRRGGGYYFNVGCSDMIVDGRIGLLQYDAIERFVADGVRLRDGTTMPADLVVVATGYESQQEVVRAHLGDAIADRIGPVWGFDDGGELAQHVDADGAGRPLVHRRQPGAVPDLFPLPGPADQGPGRRIANLKFPARRQTCRSPRSICSSSAWT